MTERDQSDPLAVERFRTDMIDRVWDDSDAEVVSGPIVAGYDVTWERGVNDAGVAVRRYVARSAWEVDPNPPAPPNDLYTLLAVPHDGPGELP